MLSGSRGPRVLFTNDVPARSTELAQAVVPAPYGRESLPRDPAKCNRRVHYREHRLATSWNREASRMAKAKEFTVAIEDKPGALGRCFLALAERGVNVLAFQSYVEECESLARFLVDDPASAQAVLGRLSMIF